MTNTTACAEYEERAKAAPRSNETVDAKNRCVCRAVSIVTAWHILGAMLIWLIGGSLGSISEFYMMLGALTIAAAGALGLRAHCSWVE